MNPATLEYAPRHAAPNRYEWEMESERARWLRRRFLWFTGTLFVFAVITLPLTVGNLFSSSGYVQASGVLQVSLSLIQVAAAGWAWWYARRAVRNEHRLFSIAFWLVIGLGVLGIFGSRLAGELAVLEELNRFEQGRSDNLDVRVPARVEIEPSDAAKGGETGNATAPPQAPRRANPAVVRRVQQGVSLGTVAWAVLTSHLIACLFLPWTVREATRPALILLAAAGFLVLGDLLLGRASLIYIAGALVVLPLTVLPGIGWSWWRYSRFRRNFRNIFESRQLRQLTHELSGARRIHETSLPPVVDSGPVRLSYIYEPMSQIGGDVLFLHPRPADGPTTVNSQAGYCQPLRQTMVLLDVTGHGIAAALTVNRIVGELERIFAEKPDIGAGELMETLNKYVYLTLATHGIFVTGLAVRGRMPAYENRADCYREPLEVTFASAGHPTAFIRRADGDIHRLESNATMLGVLPPEAYDSDEQAFDMQPGDAIVAYTDGAIEARNLDDEMIGIEGVRDLLGNIAGDSHDASRWPEFLIRRVAAWRNAPPADDTLIACVYRPAVPADLADEAPRETIGSDSMMVTAR